MQSSYRVNLIPRTMEQTINLALTHFSERIFMTRPPEQRDSTAISPVATVSPSVAIDDWDTLFTAVKDRLTLMGQPLDATGAEPPTANALELVRAGVLECVQALDQLHRTARDELAKRDLRGR